MVGERRHEEAEIATGASPFAWLMLTLAEIFFLVIANAFLFLANLIWHASKTYDAMVGKTYLLHDHGKISWIRPHDFTLYEQVMRLGMGGMVICVIIMLVFIKTPTIRYLQVRRMIHIVPIVLLIASVLFWWNFNS